MWTIIEGSGRRWHLYWYGEPFAYFHSLTAAALFLRDWYEGKDF
jgi:hypothetical protein